MWRSGNLLLSGAMLAVFVGMTAVALTYPPESRLLPLVVGIPGILLCVGQLAYELVRVTRADRPRGGADAVQATRPTVRELAYLVWFGLFVLGILLFGFLYGGPALVFAFLYIHERERLTVAAAAALGLLAMSHLVFQRLLELQLFDGLVVDWLGG